MEDWPPRRKRNNQARRQSAICSEPLTVFFLLQKKRWREIFVKARICFDQVSFSVSYPMQMRLKQRLRKPLKSHDRKL